MDQRITRIITFTDSENYGAIFQAFALYRYLELRGKNVRLEHHVRYREYNVIGLVYSALQFVLGQGIRLKRTRGFWNDHVIFSKGREWNTDDIALFGSDQIWQKALLDKGEYFYLGVNLNENIVRYSYASSFGSYENLRDYEIIYRKYISKIKRVGVREVEAQEYLEGLGITSNLVLDPTFLLHREDYHRLIEDIPSRGKDYVLCYVMTGDIEGMKRIILQAKRDSVSSQILVLGDREINVLRFDGVKRIYSAGPLEFLKLLADAKKVYTNSFHGTCFSVIFDKNFSVILNKSNPKNTRIMNILNSCSNYELYYYHKNIKESLLSPVKDLKTRIEESRNYLEMIYEG